jgi:nitrogen fixation protein
LVVSFIAITCLFLIAPVSSIRPQMLAVLLIGIAQLQLIKKPKLNEPILLFLLTVLIANFHVYWVFVPILWFLYRVVPALLRRGHTLPINPVWHALLFLFAGLCTPYTWQNYALLWDYANLAPILKESIREFRSAFAISLKIGLILSALLFTWARMVSLRRLRAKPGHYLAAALGICLSIVSVKYLTLCALFSIPFLSAAMHAGIRLHAPRLLKRERVFVLGSLIPLASLVAYSAILHFPQSGSAALEEVIAKRYAAETCKMLPKLGLAPSHGRNHVRIATDFNHGGWCRWATAQVDPHFDIRVTTDGRTQYVPAKQLEDSINLFSGRAGWENTLNELAPDAVLVSQLSALKQLLLLKPEWQVAYQDKDFAIFKPA